MLCSDQKDLLPSGWVPSAPFVELLSRAPGKASHPQAHRHTPEEAAGPASNKASVWDAGSAGLSWGGSRPPVHSLGRGTPAPPPRSRHALPRSPVSESESRPAGVQCGGVRGCGRAEAIFPLQSARCPGCGPRETRRTEGPCPGPVGLGGCVRSLRGSLHTTAFVSHGRGDQKSGLRAPARSAEGPPVVRRWPSSRHVLNGQRGEGSFWGLPPCHPPGLHPHDPSAFQRAPVFTPSHQGFRVSP